MILYSLKSLIGHRSLISMLVIKALFRWC